MARFTVMAMVMLAACAPGEKQELTEADISQKMIILGDAVSADYHDATVSLHYVSGPYVTAPFCTGTLIFDRWILTAAHCADGLTSSDVLVKFGEDGLDFSTPDYHLVTRVDVNPSYNPATISNDVALLKLASTPTYAQPVMPLPASIGLTSADEGSVVDLAGFGLQENGASSDLLHIEVAIDDVRNKEVEYDQGTGFGVGTGGACNGDSGGPAFFQRNGNTYVAGVTSYGDLNCSDFGVSMKVDAFESFIESTTGLSVEEVGGNGGSTSTTTTVTGSILEGELLAHSYVTLSAGVHELVLEGEAGTDFDLILAQRVGNKWKIRRTSESVSSSEAITVNVPAAGEFAAGVLAYSGNGDYELTITIPQ